MKTTLRCTKCQHGRIWRIEKIGVKDPQYVNGANVPLQAVGRKTNDRFSMSYDAGCIDAYVCAACGFSELYWSGLEGLQPSPPSGVHLLESEQSTPYR
ncbi:MAG: hypothetical protein U0174_08555 [Polyangiaceae bacterium]